MYSCPIPAPLCTSPPPAQDEGDAGERAQDASQAVPASWSCQSENREPHPPSPRVCLAMGGSNPWAPWPTQPKILKPGGGALDPLARVPRRRERHLLAGAELLHTCCPPRPPGPGPAPPPTRPRPPHPRPPASQVQLPVGKAGSSPCLARSLGWWQAPQGAPVPPPQAPSSGGRPTAPLGAARWAAAPAWMGSPGTLYGLHMGCGERGITMATGGARCREAGTISGGRQVLAQVGSGPRWSGTSKSGARRRSPPPGPAPRRGGHGPHDLQVGDAGHVRVQAAGPPVLLGHHHASEKHPHKWPAAGPAA